MKLRTITPAESVEVTCLTNFVAACAYPMDMEPMPMEVGAIVKWIEPGLRFEVVERLILENPPSTREEKQMKQYITTQLVEAEELEHGPFRVAFPSLGFGAVVLPDAFKAECHPIDRLEVGFGLAMEGMKHGLWFRRKVWPQRADSVGLVDGSLCYRYSDGSGEISADLTSLSGADLVAEDWVVVQ